MMPLFCPSGNTQGNVKEIERGALSIIHHASLTHTHAGILVGRVKAFFFRILFYCRKFVHFPPAGER